MSGWALNWFLREWVTAPKLPELKECLENVFRDRVGLLGCPVQDQEFDLIFTGPSQLSIFCDSMTSKMLALLSGHSSLAKLT